jgi:hypothetical protein
LRKGQRLLRREQGRRCTLACSRSGRNGRTGLGARPGPLDPEALKPGLPGRFPALASTPVSPSPLVPSPPLSGASPQSASDQRAGAT